MKMSWLLLIFVYAVPSVCQAQTSTKGSCSPVVTGNNNRFTFYCDGLTAEQGKLLLEILNRIEGNQLDPNLVMSSLRNSVRRISATEFYWQ